MTTSSAPPRDVTDEASQRGLELAAKAGDAYQQMVEYFIGNVANDGAMQQAGDYLVGVAAEEAEPLWHLLGGELQLKEPAAGMNAHLEVVVMDAADHRFVPSLDVSVTLANEAGEEIGTWDLPFLWHPTMYHYGRSVSVAESGDYSLIVGINAPSFPRHDEINGKRYREPVRVRFDDVHIETGRK